MYSDIQNLRLTQSMITYHWGLYLIILTSTTASQVGTCIGSHCMVPDEMEHVVFIHFVVMIQGGYMLKLHKTGSKRVKGIPSH